MAIHNISTIDTLSEFIAQLETRITDRNKIYLFRGQATDKALIPKIARHRFQSSRAIDERRMLRDFIINSKPFLNSELRNTLDKLTIAQHYGVPTRLLDWTENPLTALYFATNTVPNSNDNAVVYVLSLERDSDLIINDPSIDPFNLENIKFYKPENFIQRLSSQSGWLSVHPQNGFGYYDRAENLGNDTIRLSKVIISPDNTQNILQTLNVCDVNEFSIFQDMDALGKHVFRKYRND